MATTREQLKAWFRRGMKPLQSQFAAWIDSYWHKDDQIPMASIEGLDDALNRAVVTVDDAMSATSENPVQNKVVKAALDGKAATVHFHDDYAGYGDIEDLQAQIDLLAQREPAAREVVTVANAAALEEIAEPSTEVIYKTLDESKLFLWNGTQFDDVTGRAVNNYIYVADTSVLLSLTLDEGVYSVLVVEGSAVSATYSLSVANGGRVLANQDGWALRVQDNGGYAWQWHRYAYQGHTHSITDITDYTPPTVDSALSDSSENAVQNKVVKAAIDLKGDASAVPDAITLTLNPNTFEITAAIKHGNTTIATSQTIDLPLETMVVGGSYDSQTKKVVLTLKNSQTVEFSVADLVSGLANAVHTHTKSDITDFPTLGTAAALNVAESGNAGSSEVVKGNDTRLTDARTPVSHTHSIADITDYTPPADGQYSVWLNEALEQKTVPNALGAYTISEIHGYNVSTGYYSLSSGASHVALTFTNGVATGLEIVVPAGGWIRFEDVGRTTYNAEAALGVKYSRD